MKKILIILLALIAVVGLTTCDIIAAALFSVTGSVLNARSTTAAGVEGALVTLTRTDATGTPYTATTTSSGSWTITNIDAGVYDIAVTRTGWFFPPSRVEVSGLLDSTENILGIQLRTQDEYGLSFMLSWAGGVSDCDLYMTFPETNMSDPQPSSFNPYPEYSSGAKFPFHWFDGFGPSTDINPFMNVGVGRGAVYYGSSNLTYPMTGTSVTDKDDPASTGYSAIRVYLDGDTVAGGTGFLPEMITMRGIPFTYTAITALADYPFATAGNPYLASAGALSTDWYRWMGVADVYVDAYGASAYLASNNGTGAEAKIYAIQTLPNSSGGLEADLLGVYTIPTYTNIATSSVLRVHLFLDRTPDASIFEYFVIYPDIQILNSESEIRGNLGSGIAVRGARVE